LNSNIRKQPGFARLFHVWKQMTETPKVSIIIPVKPGGTVSPIAGVREAEYPAASFEVLVA